MTHLITISACLISLALAATPATALRADTDNVTFPENYQSRFIRYTSVDKPAGERPAKMRYFYVNPQSLAAAEAGKPAPEGTILVMEDHAIELDEAGNPVLDASGRFVPTDEVTNVFIQEKRAGWGTEYPEETRNGEWEYAWFLPDGTRKADASMDGCFACHKGAAADDFNFTYAPFVAAIK